MTLLLVKSPKIYLRDTGLLHSLLDIPNSHYLLGHPKIGSSWEGFVIEQILQIAGESYQYYFYRTHQGAECDLVLTKSSKPVYALEIKFSASPTLTKGNKIAFEDIGAAENFIIVPESEEFMLSEKVTVCGLNSFLEKLK